MDFLREEKTSLVCSDMGAHSLIRDDLDDDINRSILQVRHDRGPAHGPWEVPEEEEVGR